MVISATNSSWKRERFGNFYAEPSRNGITKPKGERGFGVKMVNMGELFAYPRLYSPDMARVALSESECKRFLLAKKDLLFARRSLVLSGAGKCAIVMATPEATTFESSIIRVRLDRTKVEPLYWFYYFSSPIGRADIEAIVTQLNISGIRSSELSEIQVLAPSLDIQRRIANILSVYDDLIEVNTRRIAILEEMARRLFDEWFVQFRFPGHRSEDFAIRQGHRVPAHWASKKLSDVVELKKETTTAGPHLSSRRYVPIECIGRKTLFLNDAQDFSNAQSSLQLFDKDDVLFGAMRAYFHKVMVAPFDGVTRSTCFVFRPRDSQCLAFATFLLFHENTVAFAATHSKGATIPYAAWDGSLASMPVLFPPADLLTRFERFGEPIIREIQSMFFVQANLRAARNLLLPKLISGEIDVSDAVREVESTIKKAAAE